MTNIQCKLELTKWCQNNKKTVCEYCGYNKNLTTTQYSVCLLAKNWKCSVPKEAKDSGNWNRTFVCRLFKLNKVGIMYAIAFVETDSSDANVIGVEICG
ncbi:MAG: hypothetical protein WC523_05050 [Patescibacteria group bacterium]